MKWQLLQKKILLIKLGIRKDGAASVNKESMNKSTLEFWIDGTPRLLIIPFFCYPPQPYSALPVY